MPGLSIGEFKKTFFDPQAVLKPAERAVQKRLSKFGAFVRQRARTSIRYRERPSAPGEPPSAHRTGMKVKKPRKPRKGQAARPPGKPQPSSPLRDFLFFGYDREGQTVVIGPALTNQSSRRRMEPVRGTVPSVLEEGGEVKSSRTLLITTKPGRPAPRVGGTVTIRPRPTMKPAFDAELPKFLESLKDSVTPS